MQVKILGRKCDVYILIACVVLGVFVGVNLLCNCPSCGVSGAEGFVGLEGADQSGGSGNTSLDGSNNTDNNEEGDDNNGSGVASANSDAFTLEGMTVGKDGANHAKGGVAASAAKCGQGEKWDEDAQKCMPQ